MPYSLPFVKFTAEGHFGPNGTTKNEIWRAGFHLTKNGGVIGGTSELTLFLTNIRAALTAFHFTTALGASTSAWLTDVSGAYIGTDGHYALGSLQSTTRVALTSPSSGANTMTGPFSQAMVLSLRSLLLRGPASHGRVYWPCPALSVQPSVGTISSANVTAIATAAKTLLNSINTEAAIAFGAGTSVGLVSNKGSGFQSPVIRVGIGQRMDSMESREAEIPEAHVFQLTALAAQLLEDQDDDFRRRMKEEFPDADED